MGNYIRETLTMGKYEDTVKLLTSKGKFFVDLGLDRTKEVLALFDNPQEKIKCIQIAGTNGKGSVAAILSAILTAAGYKTGLYTSPHIFEYTERIKINGVDISQEDFADYISSVIEKADSKDIHLTEFEILTVAMFKYFADKEIDIAVLETGLGGRLDATNVVSKNLCSIITHIDLDHTERLGDTKDKIAYEKAGIIKPECPVVTLEGYEAIKNRADELNSLFVLTTPYVEPVFFKSLSLKGLHQQENLALALAAIRLLFKNIDDNTIIKGLMRVHHICRFQYIKDKNLLVDGSHNPNGIRTLAENLDIYFPDMKRRFIFGCLKTKDFRKMVDVLFNFDRYEDNPPEIYFYQFDSESACSVETLQDTCIYFSKKLNSIDEIEFSDDVLTVICGSFYMLPHLIKKEWLESSEG